MYGRKMNAPYGSLCDISSFSRSDASKEIIIFRFARFTKVAPLWNFTTSVKIFKVHGIRFIIEVKYNSVSVARG